MYLPAIVMVGHYFERRRALATGIACCGSGIGGFVFAPVTEILLQEYGWKGATWVLSALMLHCLAFAMFYRPLSAPANTSGPGESHQRFSLDPGVADEEAFKLIVPHSGAGGDIIDMIDDHAKSADDLCMQTRRGIDAELRIEIYERLCTEPDGSRVYRARSYTLNSVPSLGEGQGLSLGNEVARLAFSKEFPLTGHNTKGQPINDVYPSTISPVMRKDIFYSGSITNLKTFREMGSVEEYRKKVAKKTDLATNSDKRFVRSLLAIFDFSVLGSPTFLIYGSSCFLCMAGFFVPFIYMPSHALDMGVDSPRAALLISIIGVTSTVGRVAVGFVSDQPWANSLLINTVALTTGGVATLFVPYYSNYFLLAIYAAVFGCGIAVFVSLRSVIMVELMGLEKLTTAFGFVIMCQGLSSLLGPPVAGMISEGTGGYNSAFYFAGITLTLSGLICLPLRRVANWEMNKKLTR